ncbi:MAG: shikimate kinase [Clostridiales bacterium]|jgi:shikimate kinase/3-dehydroquinate synthase|nr:shikimate kinase [Clostridiales bacterium]
MTDRQRNIALIGFMGVGKTTIGRLLAPLVAMDFVDADTEIEKKAQMPIPHIFEQYGEGRFRCLEYEFYREVMPSIQNTVIATGGGAVLDARIRAILRENALVVYLVALPETIFARIGGDGNRPVLSGDDKLAQITALLAERDALYRQTCHVVVDSNNLA